MDTCTYLIEGEDVGLVTRAIAFIAFDVSGNVFEAAEIWDGQFFGGGLVQDYESVVSFAVFEAEIGG